MQIACLFFTVDYIPNYLNHRKDAKDAKNINVFTAEARRRREQMFFMYL